MAKKVFIAATGQDIGKTTICFSLMHLATQKYQRVGFIKPLGPKPTEVAGIVVDKDAALGRSLGVQAARFSSITLPEERKAWAL